MYSFIHSSPDFRILVFNEKLSLIQRNLYGVVSLYCIMAYRDSPFLSIDEKCLESFINVDGSEMTVQKKYLCDRLDVDMTFLKTMLMIFTLSSNCLVGNRYETRSNKDVTLDTHTLFIAQNVYAEVLWKYLLHRHSYYHSIARWVQLIGLFLRLLTHFDWNYNNNHIHHQRVNECLEQILQLLLINHNQHVPFWGRDGI